MVAIATILAAVAATPGVAVAAAGAAAVATGAAAVTVAAASCPRKMGEIFRRRWSTERWTGVRINERKPLRDRRYRGRPVAGVGVAHADAS